MIPAISDITLNAFFYVKPVNCRRIASIVISSDRCDVWPAIISAIISLTMSAIKPALRWHSPGELNLEHLAWTVALECKPLNRFRCLPNSHSDRSQLILCCFGFHHLISPLCGSVDVWWSILRAQMLAFTFAILVHHLRWPSSFTKLWHLTLKSCGWRMKRASFDWICTLLR